MTDRANYLHKVSCALDALCGNLTGKKLCVCLSGGADSVSLLVSLYKLREKYNYILSAAHVNHMLRGKESERDENFCSELCDKLGIQLYITKIDIKALSVTSGKSIEETARDARYSYFKELGEKKISIISLLRIQKTIMPKLFI